MPELPEVETTRRGIEGALLGRRVVSLVVRERRLRWPIQRAIEAQVAGQRVNGTGRRAKYLLIELDSGTLISHLGMSGSLRVVAQSTAPQRHDHFDLRLDSGQCLRFNDPRRFGSLHWTRQDPAKHRLLAGLGPEPLGAEFNAGYVAAMAKGRKVAVKQFLMDQRVVVGVGNIYASEALFRAGIHPGRAAGRIAERRLAALVEAVRATLAEAIEQGGTTLRDYVDPAGQPGYFRQQLFVYERAGRPCRQCDRPVRRFVQGQRATYYCRVCQT